MCECVAFSTEIRWSVEKPMLWMKAAVSGTKREGVEWEWGLGGAGNYYGHSTVPWPSFQRRRSTTCPSSAIPVLHHCIFLILCFHMQMTCPVLFLPLSSNVLHLCFSCIRHPGQDTLYYKVLTAFTPSYRSDHKKAAFWIFFQKKHHLILKEAIFSVGWKHFL